MQFIVLRDGSILMEVWILLHDCIHGDYIIFGTSVLCWMVQPTAALHKMDPFRYNTDSVSINKDAIIRMLGTFQHVPLTYMVHQGVCHSASEQRKNK